MQMHNVYFFSEKILSGTALNINNVFIQNSSCHFQPIFAVTRSWPWPENTELHQNKMDAMQRTALSIPLCGPLECVGHEFWPQLSD